MGASPIPENRLSSAWREHLVIKLTSLDSDAAAMPDGRFRDQALTYLFSARQAAERSPNFAAGWTGVDIERAWAATHAAEVAIVRGSALTNVTEALPSLVADCASILPKDPRVVTLQKYADAGTAVDDTHRVLLADTLKSVYETSDAQHVRVRSFRNILLGATVLLTVFVLIIGIIGTGAPSAFAVCGTGGVSTACPTGGRTASGGDVFLILLLGLLAASLSGATAIRKLSGTSTPYAVPLLSLALKLPIGALTALFGLYFLRAGFGPTITALNQAQVCAYAVVFGAAQQLFMQFVDKQAKSVLDATTSPGDKTNAS